MLKIYYLFIKLFIEMIKTEIYAEPKFLFDKKAYKKLLTSHKLIKKQFS